LDRNSSNVKPYNQDVISSVCCMNRGARLRTSVRTYFLTKAM